jgi:RND family efflux transporter MFP subunit
MHLTEHRLSTALVLTVALIALAGCHGSNGDDPQQVIEDLAKAMAPREVSLVSPEVREEQPSVQLVGDIRPFDTVQISSEVGGRVDRVVVEVGDRVHSGSPMVEVDRATFKILLDQAEANLAAAEADVALAAKELERKQDLRSDETIPQSDLDRAQSSNDLAAARKAAAEASLALARRDYERSIIRAPSAGAITQRMVAAGQWADVGAPLLELAVGNKVKVAAHVPAGWARELAGLDSFTFTIGTGATTHTAAIYSVQPVVEQASRSFEVVGTAVNDGSLKPGMFANVTLVSPTATQSLWIPATAISTSDLSQVMMVEDGAVAYRKVRIGRRVDGLVEIVEGLAADEQVIADVSGLSRAIPVTVVEAS